jgi:hypothetical protein
VPTWSETPRQHHNVTLVILALAVAAIAALAGAGLACLVREPARAVRDRLLAGAG